MFMVIVSRVLGLVRQRVLAHFFTASELSLFFAAFRLPDLVFEVLVFGTFSSAFIPVFTRSLKKGSESAWDVASYVVNLGLLVFIVFSFLLGLSADKIYALFAPGFETTEIDTVARLARVLFAAQGFFVISYVLTGVLESLRRFLVPALAPLFYNLGIILGTFFLSSRFGLFAPAFGVVIGAFLHFMIQLPLAIKLGFRFKPAIQINDAVKRIGKLAYPRMIEVVFLQFSKVAELFFSSLISKSAYTYYTFGNTLQLLPIGIFGTSIAKAALPALSSEAGSKTNFRRILFNSLYEMLFLLIPITFVFIVLRIPIVRLVYGTDIFSWEATVQTGYVVSAFAIGIGFQAGSTLLARGFYALHDTKTPVIVSIISILLIVLGDFIFIKILRFDVWGLAVAFSIGSAFQAITLFYLINKKIEGGLFIKVIFPIAKSLLAAFCSGSVMFSILKIFDRSVWVKRLSFLGKLESTKTIPFERFVLDTRYTANLLILTFVVSLVGALVYLGVSLILKNDQVWTFYKLVRRVLLKRRLAPIPEEQEPVTPTPTDSASE
ncbi:murein biosynthesis integral membrane protein MurJ [Candidatus Woesebacteria bacterium RIFCSPHIGHO2_01_FULL_38_10]|nr:MAG: murein biosynthesis integral membrane protein MurJ [Candidatus Woesebacteria bacterium RIFCSPHIGHO2_01_FULL_38_10]